MKKSIFLAAMLSVLIQGALIAQTANSTEARGGSIYSSLGIGMPLEISSAGLQAQGLFGISGINTESTGLANAAMWGENIFSKASTGLTLQSTDVSTENTSASFTDLQTGYLHLIFPIKPRKIGLSVALYPYTRASYSSTLSGDFESTPTTTVGYTNEIQSVGGINKFEFGLSYRLNNNFSIGYATSLAFINLSSSESLTFELLGFDGQTQNAKVTGSTFAHRFGLNSRFRSILRDEDVFSIGATLNLPFTIDANRTFTVSKIVEQSQAEFELTDNSSSGDINIPLEYALGIGYSPSTLFSIGIESQFQQWGDYENELDVQNNTKYSNRTKLGIGGVYYAYRTNIDTFLSGFKYAAGLSYDTGHLNIEGTDIETLWLNAGIGIPSKVASFVDFSFQYGFRGTTDNNLFKERIWTVGMSVNLTELMFVRPKLR